MACAASPELFAAQRAMLAPATPRLDAAGKPTGTMQQWQNHWILALERPSLAEKLKSARTIEVEKEVAREALSWFQRNVQPLIGAGGFRQFEVTAMQVGDPENIRAMVLQHVMPVSLPSDTIYVGIAFTYLGNKKEIPWPWQARGFFTQCPEDMIDGGLWIVIRPQGATHVPTDVEQVLDNLGRTLDDIEDDATDAWRRSLKAAAAAAEATGKLLATLAIVAVGVAAFTFARDNRAKR